VQSYDIASLGLIRKLTEPKWLGICKGRRAQPKHLGSGSLIGVEFPKCLSFFPLFRHSKQGKGLYDVTAKHAGPPWVPCLSPFLPTRDGKNLVKELARHGIILRGPNP